MQLLTRVTRRAAGRIVLGALCAGLAGRGAFARARPRRHLVVIEGFRFRPRRLEIAPGDTVEWINRDIAPHSATATGGGWDTGRLDTSARAAIRFAEPGSRPYACRFHPSMRGEVVVRR